MRRGLVLIELIVGIVVSAILAGVAVPRLSAWNDAASAHGEALRVVAAIESARGEAVRRGVPVALVLGDSTYLIRVSAAGDSSLLWTGGGAALRGAALTGAGAPIVFTPAGLTEGAANRTIVVSHHAAQRRVVISRLGRITY